jgi:hypothetical protein
MLSRGGFLYAMNMLAASASAGTHATAAPVEPWEDSLRTGGAPGTVEFWYFDTVMDDGTTAGFNFFTRPPTQPAGPLKPQVSINIGRPDLQRFREVLPYSADEFHAARDHCDVRIGPNRASGTLVNGLGHYAIEVVGKETAAKLDFHAEVPPWRPGSRSGEIKPGIVFSWLPFIPYGRVEGTLTYGGATHHVRGTCYHDHNWMNVNMTSIVDHWYWGRGNTEHYRLVFVQVFGIADKIGSAPISAFMVARDRTIELGDYGQGIPLTLRTRDIAKGPGGREYPKALDFDWKGPRGTVTLSLRDPHFIEWFPVPPDDGWYYRWKADLELTVELDGTRVVERGTAIYEQLLLH